MSSWWKVQIAGTNEVTNGLKKGALLYAKNGEKVITLFDGKREFSIPKGAMKNIKPLTRLDKKTAEFVERHYQFKVKKVSRPFPPWDAEED